MRTDYGDKTEWTSSILGTATQANVIEYMQVYECI